MKPATARRLPSLAFWMLTLLTVVEVPWYWNWLPMADDAMVLGIPVWALVALIASAAVSATSAISILFWRHEPDHFH